VTAAIESRHCVVMEHSDALDQFVSSCDTRFHKLFLRHGRLELTIRLSFFLLLLLSLLFS